VNKTSALAMTKTTKAHDHADSRWPYYRYRKQQVPTKSDPVTAGWILLIASIFLLIFFTFEFAVNLIYHTGEWYLTLLVPAAFVVTGLFMLLNWGAFKFFRHN